MVPDGPYAGRPLELNADQTALLYEWYRINETGAFVYRRGAWRAAQGSGKSPLMAAVALAELVGPVRFDGWDAKGRPRGKPPVAPWVQVAACSEDQSGNVFRACYAMARDSDLDGDVLDVGLTRISVHGGGILEAVTASASSRFGQRVSFAVLDETHLWTKRNGGHRLADTIRRSAAKMNGRTFEVTNSHGVGEDSVSERTHTAALENAEGLLYVAVEAPHVEDLTDQDAVRAALAVAYGDSAAPKGWVDLARLARDIADPATAPEDARRFFMNQLTSGSTAFDVAAWAALAAPAVEVAEGTRVAVGFDGSVSDDETVIMACTEDGHLFLVGAWSRPDNAPADWRVPRADVHARLARTFERYEVAVMYADPPRWYSELDEWAEIYGDEVVLALDTNSGRRFAPLCDQFATAIAEGSLSHDGNEGVTRHLAACAKKNLRADDGRSWVIVKADTRKIDRAVAAVLAYGAARSMPEKPPTIVPLGAWR